MKYQFNEIVLAYITLGSLGTTPFGGIVASLIAIPLLSILKFLYWINFPLFLFFMGIFTLVTLIAIHLSLRTVSSLPAHAIVIDYVFGMLITFAGIPLHAKFFILGFIGFHALVFLAPYLFKSTCNLNKVMFPNLLNLLLPKIAAGLTMNLLFRIIMWATS